MEFDILMGKINILHLAYIFQDGDFSLPHECAQSFSDANVFNMTEAYLFKGCPEEHPRAKASNLVLFKYKKRDTRYIPLRAIIRLYKFCKKHEIDVVVTHRYRPAYIIGWVNLFYKFKKIFTITHGLDELSEFKRRFFYNNFLKSAINIGVSDAVRDDIVESLKYATLSNTYSISNGMDLKLLAGNYLSKEDARRELNIPSDTFVLGSIGRLVIKKGFQDIIDALKLIPDERVHFFVIGDGNYRAELEKRIAEYKLESKVTLLGEIANAYKYVKAFDTFILASHSEAQGLVFLEAMNAKVPCIGSEVGGIPDVLAGCGTLVPKKDTLALSEA
ncbi:MAG: glycosyltransferase, partial [Lentisphaeraceae bacterium]|nr:glycosyltransferase [Lentisphaeraceae bacterium]